MTTTALIPRSINQIPLPTHSLEAYIHATSQIPVLTVEEEQALASRLHDGGDLNAAQQLIMSHLRFVVHIARSYNGYGLPLGDLIQEGNVGLMKAVKRFDPKHNVRLVSFAVHWIRAEIHEFVLRNWRIVKVATTKAQRKLFFNLRGAKKRLGWLSHQEVHAVAKDLGVKPETVLEMESRLSGHDVSFDPGPDTDSDDHRDNAPALYLQDIDSDPAKHLESHDWDTDRSSKLTNAINKLDQRSRDIVQRRWLQDSKPTLQTLADEYGVSAERIRQLEVAALKKLKVQFSS